MGKKSTDGVEEAEKREDRTAKLLRVLCDEAATGGEKANACGLLEGLYREHPELAEVNPGHVEDDDEVVPWYQNLTVDDIQDAVHRADQLAAVVGDWIGRKKQRDR